MTEEDTKARQCVLVATFAALVAEPAKNGDGRKSAELKDVSGMSREMIRDAVLDAIAHPIWDKTRGGKPRMKAIAADKLVVFREKHVNGKFHFHVAVRFDDKAKWLGFKSALLDRHGLASQPC